MGTECDVLVKRFLYCFLIPIMFEKWKRVNNLAKVELKLMMLFVYCGVM